MKLTLKKQILIRKKYKEKELKQIILKFFLIKQLNLPQLKKNIIKRVALISFFNNEMQKFKINKSKIYRYCELTNRRKGTIRQFGLSRILMRELLNLGKIPGYVKRIW